MCPRSFTADTKAMTQLDTPKSDYRERTGTEWLVLGSGVMVMVMVSS